MSRHRDDTGKTPDPDAGTRTETRSALVPMPGAGASADAATTALDPFRQPVHTLQMAVRQRGRSPLYPVVWKRALMVAALSVLVGALAALGEDSSARLWLTLPVVGAAWVLAVRLLLLDTALRRFWLVWLLVSLIGIPIAGDDEVGYAVALAFGIVFLLVRRYRPYRHLSSRRRAGVFLCGLASLTALFLADPIPSQGSWFPGVLRQATNYALVALRLFWVFSLLTLFLGMRLHFLRLRPKLAVTGLLLLLVPFVLVVVLAVIALFGAIGGSRASQGRDVLAEWVALTHTTPELARELFGSPISPDDSSSTAIARAVAGSSLAGADTTLLVHDSEMVFLWQAPAGRSPQLFAVAERVEPRLSALLDCEASLNSANTFNIEASSGSRIVVTTDDDEAVDQAVETAVAQATGAADESGRAAAAMQASESPGSDAGTTATISLTDLFRVQKLTYFGAAPIAVMAVSGDSLRQRNVLLTLKARPIDVARSYVSQDNPVTFAVVIALGVVAALFLVLEGFALFFGLRIVGGITSAVRTLHRGTERVSRGELDARIELPNEDEFGDLADSFNEMTAAIRVGQEQAVQRERLEQELMLARRIQERLLPRGTPQVPGYQIAGTSIPSLMVGGDYFDFLELGDGRLGIAVGDVSGKGIPAAMLMSNLHASLHGQVIHPSSVGEVVQRINTLLARSTDPHMFATFIFGVLDTPTGTLTFANAGHDRPVLVRGADGRVERPGESDLILGMLPGQAYRESTVQLAEGDVLVFYTDGVSEAVAPAVGTDEAEFFGEEQLVAVVSQHARESAEQIQRALIEAVRKHAAGRAQSDDITLVVLKRSAN